MSRLILLCEHPRHLSRDESVLWLRRSASQLADGRDVVAIELTELESPSLRWSRSCDWMVEAQLANGVNVQRLVDSPPWRDMLADLRLLGMRPSLAVADPANTSRLGSAG